MATFTGTAGDDVANATTGVLTGFAGGTVAELQDGTGDTFDALGGNDTIIAGNGADTINDTAGTKTTIDAGGGADTITIGTTFADPTSTIDGGGGNDLLIITGGNANIAPITITNIERLSTSGGSITGTATQFAAFGRIDFNSANPTAGVTLTLAATGGPTTLDLSVALASGGLRSVFLTGSSDSETLIGSDANDTISGGVSGVDTLFGGSGADTLNASGSDGDFLYGGIGNDTLNGASGNDTLDGGDGNDTIFDIVGAAGSQSTTITAGLGDDTVTIGSNIASGTIDGGADSGAGVRDTLSANANLNLTGVTVTGFETLDTNGNTITATAAQFAQFSTIHYNSFNPSVGVTLALAASGPSTTLDISGQLNGTGGPRGATVTLAAGSTGDVIITTGDGNDTVTGGAGSDTLTGGLGNDTLNAGTGGVDTLYGGLGDDTLNASGSDGDFLYGGTGNDTLNGASGNDTLDGGDGNDTIFDIVGAAGSQSTTITAGLGDDTVTIGSNIASGTIDGGADSGAGVRDTLSANANLNLTGVTVTGFETLDTNGNTITATAAQFAQFSTIRYNSFNPSVGVTLALAATGTAGSPATTTVDLFGALTSLGSRGATVTGSLDNETIATGTASDTLDGGAGIDTADYSRFANNLTVTLNGATNATVTVSGGNNDTIKNFENFTGGSGADNITGDGLDNVLNGGAGNDTINGGAGNDTIIGGRGANILNGGTNTAAGDTVSYAAETVGVTVTLNATGNGSTVDTATSGTLINDTLTGIENVTTGAGSDTFVLTNSVGRIIDAGGITGFGPDNANRASYSSSTAAVALDVGPGGAPVAGHDRLRNITNVTGSTFADTFNLTNSGDGGSGAGGRFLTGGGGTDTANYAGATGGISVIAGPVGSNPDTYDRLIGFAIIIGGSGADIFGMADGADQSIAGGSGIDLVAYNADYTGVSITNAIDITLGTGGVGTATDLGAAVAQIGTDTLSGIENIFTGSGNDRFFMSDAGDNVLDGNLGRDLISYASATNAVTVNLLGNIATGVDVGTDTLLNFENVAGGSGSDSITGNALDNSLYGGAGDDTITGGAGNDYIVGGLDADTMVGGTGNDTYFIDNVGDVVVEAAGEGIDTVFTSVNLAATPANVDVVILQAGATQVTGGDQTDRLLADTASAVTLYGGGGVDVLSGARSGGNTLYGGDGADQIYASRGRDPSVLGGGGGNTLYGGAGDDVYYSENASDLIIETDANRATGGYDILNASYDVLGLAANVEQLILTGSATHGVGNAGSNTILGRANQGMTLDGGDGNDYLSGTAFDDTLIGGNGIDTLDLTLGGNDTLDYRTAGFGDDAVVAFDSDATGGQDLIDISGRGFTAAGIGIGIVIRTIDGTDTQIRIGNDTIRLFGVDASTITASDFKF